MPTEEDYADLAAAHDAGWLARAREAVAEAAQKAEESRGEIHPVHIDRVNASVAQGHRVQITVVEEYAERWVIVDRLTTDKQVVDYAIAFALATAAFEGVADDDIEEIFETTEILDGREIIEPGKSYAWLAVV